MWFIGNIKISFYYCCWILFVTTVKLLKITRCCGRSSFKSEEKCSKSKIMMIAVMSAYYVTFLRIPWIMQLNYETRQPYMTFPHIFILKKKQLAEYPLKISSFKNQRSISISSKRHLQTIIKLTRHNKVLNKDIGAIFFSQSHKN